MRVEAERLVHDDGRFVDFVASPNCGKALVRPTFLVIHYTAGRGLDESVRWLCSPKAKASAHLVIGRDGTIKQLVRFDMQAWHAGKSQYAFDRDGKPEKLVRLNEHSIGIELDNPGPLVKRGAGWSTYFGRSVPAEEVVMARHKHAPDRTPETGWAEYPEAQILAAYAACEALIDRFGDSLIDVIGHEDIAIGRKRDPGPAFPMESFRSWLFGRQ